MKMIPFSSATEFQKESQRAVRNTGFAESAVWAVFATSSVISILFSLSQMVPTSKHLRFYEQVANRKPTDEQAAVASLWRALVVRCFKVAMLGRDVGLA
jgi:hypothetical protein